MSRNKRKTVPIGISNVPLIGFGGMYRLIDYSLITSEKEKSQKKEK